MWGAGGYGRGAPISEVSWGVETVGLSVGITAADAPPVALWAEIIGMFVGRLELYVVFVAAVQFGREVKGGYKNRKRGFGSYVG